MYNNYYCENSRLTEIKFTISMVRETYIMFVYSADINLIDNFHLSRTYVHKFFGEVPLVCRFVFNITLMSGKEDVRLRGR